MQYVSYCFTDSDKIGCHDALATATLIPGQCIRRGMTLQKVSVSFYYLPKNSEKSANNRFRAKLVKYSNFYDIFADVWPMLMEYCMMTHISYPEHNCRSKVKFKKKSRWWTLSFKKIVKYDISAIVSLILIKFAATMHISHCNFNSRSVHS